MKPNMNARHWLMAKVEELGFSGTANLIGISRQNLYLMRGKIAVPVTETRRTIASCMTAEGIVKDEWDVKLDFLTCMVDMERAVAAVDNARSATDNGPAHNADGSTT